MWVDKDVEGWQFESTISILARKAEENHKMPQDSPYEPGTGTAWTQM
jgi:hypothetical protein